MEKISERLYYNRRGAAWQEAGQESAAQPRRRKADDVPARS